MKARSKSGFTLVEILIVVVILGILAAIVIPQFSEASTQARTSSVQSNLQMIRSQIELYKIQHKDQIPGSDSATFIANLTSQTDIDGGTVEAGETAYGPYMQKWPTNALNDSDALEVSAAAATATEGWHYHTDTGEFTALDATVDTSTW